MTRVCALVILLSASIVTDEVFAFTRFGNTSEMNGGLIDFAAINPVAYDFLPIYPGEPEKKILQGMTKNGEPVFDVSLVGSELVGYVGPRDNRVKVEGDWFVGAILQGTLLKRPEDPADAVGGVLDLIIEDYRKEVVAGGNDWEDTWVTTYVITTLKGESICGYTGERDNPIKDRAIIVNGAWNDRINDPLRGSRRRSPEGIVTLACLKGAIGKCAAAGEDELLERRFFGYNPEGRLKKVCDRDSCWWEFVDLKRAHQACTRMVRADYCGEGVSYTVEGEKIDAADRYGLNVFTKSEFEYEALWDDVGALDLDCPRQIALFEKGKFPCPALDLRAPDKCKVPIETPVPLAPKYRSAGNAPPKATAVDPSEWDSVGKNDVIYHGLIRNTHEPEPKKPVVIGAP